jgi:hypothetical protein
MVALRQPPTFGSEKKIVGTTPTLSTNARAWLWPHGHQATSQRASGLCGHRPHDPPLKYYKLQAGGRVPGGRLLSAWRGVGRAGGQGPRQRRGHKQNFL